MSEQCFFKTYTVRQKRKEGWKEAKVSARRKKKDESQDLVLMERK